MNIASIDVKSVYASCLSANVEGVVHTKTLSRLSVVQAAHGRYEISLNDCPSVSTGEGGAFLAPAGALQRIIHHNGVDGIMRARWVFLEIVVNSFYSLDDLFEFPLILPAVWREEVGRLIERLQTETELCERYIAAYRLTEILMKIGKPRLAIDKTPGEIRDFVAQSCGERLCAEDIAAHIHCSVSQVFRYTKRYFGLTPANYINSVRLGKAAEFLEKTDRKVIEIAYDVGFGDLPYFSRLFRRAFSMSPQEYRRFMASRIRGEGSNG